MNTNGSKAAAEGSAPILGLLMSKAPSAAAGVGAAVLTVLAMDHWRARAPEAAAATKEAAGEVRQAAGGERVVRNVVVDRHAFDRIAALERQVSEMQAAKAAGAAAGSAAAEEPLDPAEARRRVEEAYAELDRAHERDAPDPDWAPAATQGLATGVRRLGEKLGFTLNSADCKTTTCRATVTWANYETARATGVQLVEQAFGNLNCEQKIRLAEPADPNAPYSARVYLDCADLRAGAVEEIGRD